MREPKQPLTKHTQNVDRSGLDKCWHIPVIAALAMLAASIGRQNSGIFYVGLMELFKVNRSEASWPNSVAFVLVNLSGVVFWILSLRLSAYQINLIGSVFTWAGVAASALAPSMPWVTATLGAIYGAGFGIVTLSLAYINILYFDKYRGIACGVKFAGAYLASLIFPPALVYFEEAYGFRGALLLSGALTMHVTAFCIPLNVPEWMRDKPQFRQPTNPPGDQVVHASGQQQKDGSSAGGPKEEDVSKVVQSVRATVKILRMPMCYLIVAYVVIADFAAMAFQSTIVDYAIDKGFPLEKAQYVVVFSSAGQLGGCLIVPLIADRGLMNRSTLVTVNFFVLGCSLLILAQVTLYSYIVIFCFCVAASSAFLSSIKAAIITDYLGAEAISVVGALFGISTLPLFLCNPGIIGVFRDSMGSYDNYYRLHGGLQLFAVVMFSSVRYFDNQRCNSWSPK